MFAVRLLASAYAIALVSAEASPRTPVEPSYDSARDNAHLIFNAIHSAGRQWGSSLNHNGFGFFPAVMPKGTLLYHGSRLNEPPAGPEWLAFEVEHSENFAGSFKTKPGTRPPPNSPAPNPPHKGPGDDGPQKSLNGPESSVSDNENRDGEDDDKVHYYRGYLHTYRANRDLNLLYVDGMAAGKTLMGTLDTQDLVLRGNRTTGPMGEWERAVSVCDTITKWGYDGLMRAEIGFEVIYCNFTVGVDLVSLTRTIVPPEDEPGKLPSFFTTSLYHWARAVAERYDGLGGDRVRFDFSSMVSGFFFPISISSTDPERPDLLRLAAATDEELHDIKTHVHDISKQPRKFNVNWQGVVDMIVSRYAERLAAMGSRVTTDDRFLNELERATLTYFDAPPDPADINSEMAGEQNRTADALTRCREHYLLPVTGGEDEWSLEDKIIHTALDTVMHDICSSLYTMRSIILDVAPDPTTNGYFINQALGGEEIDRAINTTRAMTQDLLDQLAWTEWKKTRRCAVNEVFFVAMWPFGKEEDHWNPGCRSIADMQMRRSGYWMPSQGPPPENDTDST